MLLYNILTSLVVNTNQINIYIVPMVGQHTWEICGKKDVAQIQVEEKSIKCVVSCIPNGNLIPFQVVYKGKTNRSLPKSLEAKGLWIIAVLPWFCLTIIG
jgi:hypothetical protein